CFLPTLEEVKECLPTLLWSGESMNLMDIAIALPLFFSARMAERDKVNIMLSGQGADEIFAGYQRYERKVREDGYQGLQDALSRDVMNLSCGLERDRKICMTHYIDVRFPYLDLHVLDFSMKIPADFKIHLRETSYIRKHLLRH
ncbi:MAG: asparagine synthetase B, partial [Candidatus Bathyarchaeota archaeon]